MNRPGPLFSIITVTYNAADAIAYTLKSVEGQSHKDYEHLIIDGGSTDATVDIIKAHSGERLRYITEHDLGIYDAMNKGLSMAKGKYVIFLNAGDRFGSEHTLQHYAEAIAANGCPGILYGQTRLISLDGSNLGERHLRAPEKLTLKSFADGMVVCHQAMAVHSNIAQLFNLSYKLSSDYEWVILCLQRSKCNVYLPEVTALYLSEGATTANHKESLVERFKIMCTYYGTVPTVLRHFKFALRYLRRRGKARSVQ